MFESKYTPAAVDGFCRAFASGLTIAQSARTVGLTRQTICRWVWAKPDFADRFEVAQNVRDLIS